MRADETSTPSPDARNERDRLDEIAALDLFSDDARDVLTDVADDAARLLDVPITLISIVLSDAQYFVASHGLSGWLAETQGTPVEWSFCAHAVENQAPFVVEDATTHPLTKENPLVTEDGIRCYYGIPLTTSRGYTLGTLCAIGVEARTFTDEEVDQLQQLADEAMTRIEARR